MKQNKHEIGRNIGPELAKLIEPSEIFVGNEAEKLYDLENRRNLAIQACAKEWGNIREVGEDAFWTHLMPQALFDTLESYSPQYSIIAAEAFLKQFGWKIERPDGASKIDPDQIALEAARELQALGAPVSVKRLAEFQLIVLKAITRATSCTI